MWFRPVMDAVWLHLFEWDFKKNKSTGKRSLYQGITIGASEGSEEQSRKELHAHCSVWIEGTDILLSQLQSSHLRLKQKAETKIIQIHDATASTELIDSTSLQWSIFPHEDMCPEITNKEFKPVPVNDQHIRNMRHKSGGEIHNGTTANCNSCNYNYSIDNLVSMFLKEKHHIELDYSKLQRGRIEEMVFQNCVPDHKLPTSVAYDLCNLAKNLHDWNHCPQCFKGVECRYNIPKPSSQNTCIKLVKTCERWTNRFGENMEYKMFDIITKRNSMDIFMNQYSKVISFSKLGSNSNAQLCLNEESAIYSTKYETKDNQKDDQGSYSNVIHYIQKRLATHNYEHDFSEALSRVIGASLAHSTSNVIGPWLAKHLTIYGSRFRFSTEFRNIPHIAMAAELFQDNGYTNRILKFNKGNSYIDSKCLQYLYRPNVLNNSTLEDFCLNYHVARTIRKKKSNAQQNSLGDNSWDFDFQCDEYEPSDFQHVNLSKDQYIPAIDIWNFPDTSFFSSSLKDPDGTINEYMEAYSRVVLLCYYPYRRGCSLMIEESYTKFLRKYWLNSEYETVHVQRRLTNLQNLKNALREKRAPDPLSETTTQFYDPSKEDEPISHEKAQELNEAHLALIETLIQVPNMHIETNNINNAFSLESLQFRGTHLCGIRNLPTTTAVHDDFFVESHSEDLTMSDTPVCTVRDYSIKQKVHKRKITEVLLETRERIVNQRLDTQQSDSNDETDTSDVIDVRATGTPQSICLWARACGFDAEQARAFEILCGKFVLGFFNDAERDNFTPYIPLSTMERSEFHKCHNLLKKLVGPSIAVKTLRMFLTGPGGSGKSEVINQLLAYASEYCIHIGYPFTKNTIMVTACSGVAATLILGQTIHNATGLMKNIFNIDVDSIQIFTNSVCMIIIDEISLLTPTLLQKLDKHLNLLKGTGPYAIFGNVDIAFMGDFRQLCFNDKATLYDCKYLPIWKKGINCFIELKGMWRYKNDVQFGLINFRFRDGHPLPTDFTTINSRYNMDTPPNCRVACVTNEQREAVNVGTWLKHITDHGEEQGMVILADNVLVNRKARQSAPLQSMHIFYTEVGEDNCKSSFDEGRFTPMLRTYPLCPLMLTHNKNVECGLANGTQGLCKKIVLKVGELVHYRYINDFHIKCCYASQIHHIDFLVDNKTHIIEPKHYKSMMVNFPLLPESGLLPKRNRTTISIKATQIPLTSNNATTGHKLQGSSVDNISIPRWNYKQNWAYVTMSRVRTLNGLFIGEKLDPTRDYSVPPKLTAMYKQFRKDASPESFDYSAVQL